MDLAASFLVRVWGVSFCTRVSVSGLRVRAVGLELVAFRVQGSGPFAHVWLGFRIRTLGLDLVASFSYRVKVQVSFWPRLNTCDLNKRALWKLLSPETLKP